MSQQQRKRRRRSLQFTKMQGLGNDFVVIDLLSQHCHINERLIRRLADRRYGIGCDQVLLVEPPQNPDVDFRYRIFNGDGQEVEQCGNGARCFARFVQLKNLTSKDRIRVETLGGIMELELLARGQVRVDMGAPQLDPASIPFTAEQQRSVYTLQAGTQTVEFGAVSMGNPHAVLLVEDVEQAPVEQLGQAIQQHPDFPRQVNVGFMQIMDRKRIRLRVYERGAGETLACGSGACAAVVSGILRDELDHEVEVELRGGSLNIRWDGGGESVLMTGPASIVFEGQIRL